METVIVAFENAATGQRFGELLESAEAAKCTLCRTGDQVRRLLSKQRVYCVVCSPHLPDGPAEWLYEDLPPSCSLLLVGPQHILDACGNRDIYKLPTPIRKEEALSTVRLLLQFGHKIERLLRPRRSGADQELVQRAKELLMARKSISEEEAHRLLQRRSMDAGIPLSKMARFVIDEEL